MTELLIRNEEMHRLARKILAGIATDADFQTANIEDVRAIKCDTGTPHYKAMVGDVEKVASDTGRKRKFISSRESRDRMGDVIEIAGWDHTNFNNNPVALWAHQDKGLPLGSVSDTTFGEVDGVKTMWQSIDYVPAKLNPMAEAVLGLVDAGVLKAVSVGFLPLQPPLWPKTAEERESLDLGPFGVRYQKHEQLELSVCTIPAHPGALASKAIRRAVAELADDGKISRQSAGALLDDIESRRAKRKGWLALPRLPEPEEEISDPAADEAPTKTADTVAVRPAQTSQAQGEVFSLPPKITVAGSNESAWIWDPRATGSSVAARSTTDDRADALHAKLERTLIEIAEVRETQGDICEALTAVAESIDSLHGVLRSSSRSADATRFYGEAFRAVQAHLRQK